MLNNNWNNNYSLSKEYYDKFGDLKITYFYEKNNIKLGFWISTQRKNYKKGIMDEDRIKKLNDINMVWDASENMQNTWFGRKDK